MKLWVFIACIFLIACTAVKKKTPSRNVSEEPDLGQYFDKCNVKGSFVLFSEFHNLYVTYNERRDNEGFLPASTFKILNSLIALETGVAPDENLVIPWDSVTRSNAEWNKDQTMRSAFKTSCVPYYQEIARRIGYKQMKKYVKAADYGQMDLNRANLDSFWLRGNSRITPFEQVDFLRRLYKYELPFSKRNVDIVKDMMWSDSTHRYIMRSKTGWALQNDKDIGWMVGIFENIVDGHVYYYATNIEAVNPDPENFARCRKEITYKMFRELGTY